MKALEMGHAEKDQWRTCQQSEQVLRAEIDRLRLRNQELYTALAQAERLGTRLQKTAVAALLGGRTLLWRLLDNVKTRVLAKNEPEPQSNFTPYCVCIRQTPQPQRPRVLHFIANFYTGGSAQLVVDLIERLGHQFEQEVVSRDLPASLNYTGLRLHHYKALRNHARIDTLLRRFNPHIIHVHFFGHHENDYSRQDWQWYHQVFQSAEQHGSMLIENLNIPVEPYVSDVVRCYVHVSDYVKCHFGRFDSYNRTIYPGSDLHFFSRSKDRPLPDDHIGMVYRLEGDKLDPLSIDVLIEVVRRRRNTKAIVVGGGTYLELYQERVEQAGFSDAFTFTGYVSFKELPGLYEKMSLFVAPVHTESFGQVSAFAMGMELPVVGYQVGALPEIVGNPALLAPPGDSTKLADIIIDLLDDRARRLQIGVANRQRAEENFSVEAMTDQYAQLYAALIK